MPDELEKARVFDVNGEKYRVGMDQHGYVRIQHGRVLPDRGGGNEFVPYESESGDVNRQDIMLDPQAAANVADHLLFLVG